LPDDTVVDTSGERLKHYRSASKAIAHDGPSGLEPSDAWDEQQQCDAVHR
jgi:hypothetical protein